MVHVSSESSVCCFPIHARSSVPFYRIDEFDLIHVCYIVLFISNAGISIAMITRGYPNCGCSKFEQIIFPNSRFIHGLSMVYPWFIHGLSMVYPWFIHGLSMVYPWFIMVPNFWLLGPWNHHGLLVGWFIGPKDQLRRDTGGCNLKGCCPTFTVMAPLSPGDSKASVFARTEEDAMFLSPNSQVKTCFSNIES